MRSVVGFVAHEVLNGLAENPCLEFELIYHVNFPALWIATGLTQKKVESLTDVRLQFFAGDHGVEEAML